MSLAIRECLRVPGTCGKGPLTPARRCQVLAFGQKMTRYPVTRHAPYWTPCSLARRYCAFSGGYLLAKRVLNLLWQEGAVPSCQEGGVPSLQEGSGPSWQEGTTPSYPEGTKPSLARRHWTFLPSGEGQCLLVKKALKLIAKKALNLLSKKASAS
jgi:hypothetical protein